MSEHVLLLLPDGTVVGVHSDDIPWEELGRVLGAPRLSTVEFDPDRQRWVATDLETGTEIASGPSRARVLEAEAAHYNARLASGHLPEPAARLLQRASGG
jgi:hypothetical protein